MVWPILGFGAVGRIGDDGMKRERPSAAIDGGEEGEWLPGSKRKTFEEDECGRRGCENVGQLLSVSISTTRKTNENAIHPIVL